MEIALIGNPNCGKTTLYNKLTKSTLPVGNRAGVTVSITKGRYKNHNIYDLPGIYSLVNSNNEENVTADFLEGKSFDNSKKKPDYILNVIDADYLSRSLLLTSQLLAKKIPMTVVLNMTDKKSNRHRTFDGEKLSKILGCNVVILKRNEKNFDMLFSQTNVKNYKTFFGTDREKFLQFDNIEKEVVTGKTSKKITTAIDRIFYSKYLSFPVFFLIMSAVLFLSSIIGSVSAKYISLLSDKLSVVIHSALYGKVSDFLLTLLADGILNGISGVLSFLPMIVSLFFMLNLLEDIGYLSRVAVIFDRIFSSVGVSGKTAITLLLGCSCTVPAIMSAKTLDLSERKKSLSVIHFVPCSAKIPVLTVLFCSCFDKGFLLVPFVYLLSVGIVFLYLFLTDKKDLTPLLMEIPTLKMPDIISVTKLTFKKIKSFLFRVCTVVFVSSVCIFVLLSFDFSFQSCSAENSILVSLCSVLRYLFLPIGLDDWKIVASYIAGFSGKETILSVLNIVSNGNLYSVANPFVVLQYSVFLLLSPPCAASLTALKKELGKKEFFICLSKQFVIAYAVCLFINVGFLLSKAIFN